MEYVRAPSHISRWSSAQNSAWAMSGSVSRGLGKPHCVVCAHGLGLGNYGRTLTVLHSVELPDPDDEDEETALVESWTPRFR